jgi:hypothetical protein
MKMCVIVIRVVIVLLMIPRLARFEVVTGSPLLLLECRPGVSVCSPQWFDIRHEVIIENGF